jgi:hypothetical protein
MSEIPPLSIQRVDDGALTLAADVVLDQLGVGGDGVFLVVSNPELGAIATELAEAARRRTERAEMQEFGPTGRDGAGG